MAHTWAKDFVKSDGHNVELIDISFSGSRGTVKPYLVKVICNAISETLFYHCNDPEIPRVFLPGPIGISAVNIGGFTIHFGL